MHDRSADTVTTVDQAIGVNLTVDTVLAGTGCEALFA